VSRAAIEAALRETDGNLERTWRKLGLGSRHVLARLMTRHGIVRRKTASADAD
jgi:DNA-binding NtrC family response regulator